MTDILNQKDIIQIVQNRVDEIALKDYKDCATKEKDLYFWVSRLFEGDRLQKEKIILTIKHMGICFSRVLYPEEDSFYGLSTLEKVMEDLYNQTM